MAPSPWGSVGPQLCMPSEQSDPSDRLLRHQVRYAAACSPFYRRHFAASRVDVDAFRGAIDLPRLPLTTKADLERSNDDFLAVAQDEIVDVCLTSGTTGQPVALLQSREDLERLAQCEAAALSTAGVKRGDRVLVTAAIDRCFMAGLAYFLGLVKLGACVLRGGSSHPVALARLLRAHRPSAIIGVPSTLLATALELRRDGIDPASLGLQRLVCIGEPIRQASLAATALGVRLSEEFGAPLYGTYASTEVATAFTECSAGAGGHVQADHVAVEILDDAGAPVPPGVPGEVVATPLQVRGMPLIRVRTGDIAALLEEPCLCGRPTPRIGPVLGRKSQMLKVRGTTVYPLAITQVIQGLAEIECHYVEASGDFALSESVCVVVGVANPAAVDPARIADRVAAVTRVRPEVRVASVESVARATKQEAKRKPVLFFDRRRKADA